MIAAAGFSLVEALLALSLTLVVTGAAMALVNPTGTLAKAQPEAIDVQQRVRVAVGALLRDLNMAGAGMNAGPRPGQLVHSFAPVIPRRLGAQSPDAATTVRSDAITVTYVPPTYAQASINGPLPQTPLLTLNPSSSCPAGQTLCGFKTGTTIAVFDLVGHFDLFNLTQVQSTGAQWQLHGSGSGATYPSGTPVAEVQSFTYYFDAANRQLRQYDGYQTDVPVVDSIASLSFEYFGDPQPPDQPRPPLGTENCLYDADGQRRPMPILAGTGSLVPLPLAMLGDGPWCGGGATAFDADLLRVRLIKASFRVQPGSSLYRVPDGFATFSVAPRNLNGGR